VVELASRKPSRSLRRSAAAARSKQGVGAERPAGVARRNASHSSLSPPAVAARDHLSRACLNPPGGRGRAGGGGMRRGRAARRCPVAAAR
jgi:hypothetical protein